MKYIYNIITTQEIDGDGILHAVYGIECTESEKNITVRRVENVFTSHDAAEKLTGLINSLRLSPLHLDDVIADAIAG